MRKSIIVSIFLLISICTFGQKYRPSSSMRYSRVDNKILHFGFTLGVGVYDYSVKNSNYNGDASYRAELVKFTPTFRLGALTELNINRDFSLRFLPGLYFGKRKLSYVNVEEGKPEDTKLVTSYGEFPLLLKYKAKRIGNYAFFVTGGASYRFDLNPHDHLKPSDGFLIKTLVRDFAVEIGGGMDLYLEYFKLGVEMRISIGLKDIFNHDLDPDYPEYHDYTLAVEQMKSNMVSLLFHFE